MPSENQHYYSEFPDGKVKFNSMSVSLRRHLYFFKTVSGVFSYKKLDLGTKVLVENMFIPRKSSTLLDLGCGYGVIGIVLACEAPMSTIYFIDINKRAIWCTKENIKINLRGLKDRFNVLNGKYFEPIKNNQVTFDGIFMNPPLRQGRADFLNLFNELPKYLNKKGLFQFVIKKKMGAKFILEFLLKKYSKENVNIICKKSGYWVFKYIQK